MLSFVNLSVSINICLLNQQLPDQEIPYRYVILLILVASLNRLVELRSCWLGSQVQYIPGDLVFIFKCINGDDDIYINIYIYK